MSGRVVIIDYGMGNVASVSKAFYKLGAKVSITADPTEIDAATHLVLPGVGAFPDSIGNLQKSGLVGVLNQRVLKEKVPFLGICLGMQLLATKSHEFGEHEGLGWIQGEVKKLNVGKLRLPHMGWNDVATEANDPMFKGVIDFNFYFVHSYHLICEEKKAIVSTCDYGERFVSSLKKDNIWATQFHPEKSQISGLCLLENFLKYA